jgi:hypothetical protein
MQNIFLASRDVRTEMGVYMKMLQGKRYWCIAFAVTDPCERLPPTALPEEQYKTLKEALQKDGPPR